MTYDLFVLPVDRAMTYAEASAEVDRRQRAQWFRRRHEARMDPFIAALGRRYWQVLGRSSVEPPFEFDIARSYIFVGVPWDRVDEVLAAVADAAFATGMAVWDPQRELVGLPAPFASAPMDTAGTAPHVERAARELATLGWRAMARPMHELSLQPSGHDGFMAAAFRNVSPLGFEITPDIAAEVEADPARVPGSLQTEARRDQLVAELTRTSSADRHIAVAQLAGWDPDPIVAAALRPLLASEDVFEASQAATGVARQGDATDLPAVLEVVHRLSPADGASQATMVQPLRAALALAATIGPEIVEGVRARARGWRAGGARRPAWDRDADAELDALLEG